MLGSNYNKRISIYTEQSISDGYGGFTTEKVFVRKVWAKVSTKSVGYKFQQFGLNEFKNPVIFSIRAKINLNIDEKNFIQYKGKDLIIKGIEEVNLEGIEINIMADEN